MFTFITPAGNTVTTEKDISIIPNGFCCCGCDDEEWTGKMCSYWESIADKEDPYKTRCNLTGEIDSTILHDGLKICGIGKDH